VRLHLSASVYPFKRGDGGYDRIRGLGFLVSGCRERFKARVVMVRLHVGGGDGGSWDGC